MQYAKVRLAFEFDRVLRVARLHVTNEGAPAAFWAPLTVDGQLSAPLDERVFSSWEHCDGPTTTIATGDTRTLRLARLETSSFPFAQWLVYFAGTGGGVVEAPALHASVVGGLADTQAPPMDVHVSVVSASDDGGESRTCIVTLRPFTAEARLGT